jgi:hypothetical protein
MKIIFKATYVKPSEKRGARVKLTNLNMQKGVFKPYLYSMNNLKEIATHYIFEQNGSLVVTDTFWDKEHLYLITKPNYTL